MKLDLATHRTLAAINAALLKGNDSALERAFDGADLSRLLSQDTLSVVRALGKTPLVLLLNTLAVHNEVEAERAQHWLACYQSVVKKALEPRLAALSTQHVLRVATQRLLGASDSSSPHRLKGSAQAWQDAVELALDHKDWVLAADLLHRLGHGASDTEAWQRVSRSLSRRHRIYVDETGLQQVDVDYPALAHLYDVCADAARRHRTHAVFRALKQLSASALEIGGNPTQAISRLRELDPAGKDEVIQLDIARCLCKQGDLAASVAMLDSILSARAERKSERVDSLHAVQGNSDGHATDTHSFDTAKASTALHALTEIANGCQVPVFLVSGTLLGYVREGQLLAHDKDIDVGIVGWEHQYELCLALQQSGRFTVSAQFLKGKDTVYFPVRHNDTGMWIDVFVYHPQEGQLVTGVDFFFGYRQTFGFTPFELKDIEFLGVRMQAPADTERNLCENFGPGWRVPDSAYLSHLESPSTREVGALPYMLTARLTALAACIKQQPGKLAKVLDLMEGLQDKASAMPLPLIQAIRKGLLPTPPVTNPPPCEELQHA